MAVAVLRGAPGALPRDAIWHTGTEAELARSGFSPFRQVDDPFGTHSATWPVDVPAED